MDKHAIETIGRIDDFPGFLAASLDGVKFKQNSENEIDIVIFSMMAKARRKALLAEQELDQFLDERTGARITSALIFSLVAIVATSWLISFVFFSIFNIYVTSICIILLGTVILLYQKIVREQLFNLNASISKATSDVFIASDAVSGLEKFIKMRKFTILAKMLFKIAKTEGFFQGVCDRYEFLTSRSLANCRLESFLSFKAIDSYIRHDSDCVRLILKLEKLVIVEKNEK
jgi:hypothetical protein